MRGIIAAVSVSSHLPVQGICFIVGRVDVRIGKVSRANVLEEDQEALVAYEYGAEFLMRAQHRRNVSEQHSLRDTAALHGRTLGFARRSVPTLRTRVGHWTGAAAFRESVEPRCELLLLVHTRQVPVQLSERRRLALRNSRK